MTEDTDPFERTWDVLVVGGGVAGLSAGIFTARAGLATLVVDADESILARNAHLENYPGFPAGIDARRFLGMVRDQASEAGCESAAGRVTDVALAGNDPDLNSVPGAGPGFTVTVEPVGDQEGEPSESTDPRTVETEQVIAASWSDASYLAGLDVDLEQRGSKTFVMVDDRARTGVEGLYAAGRVADQYHQTVVAAGHGATAGLTAIHATDRNFYHDWVTPERYFTGRDREVPPGCEEIDDAERERRERNARERIVEYFADAPTGTPTMHPSVAED